MIQQDYILRLTQQVAQVLAKMMGKNWVDVMPEIEVVYKDWIPIDRATIIGLPPEQIIPLLVEEKDLELPYLEALAELLYFEGMRLHEANNTNDSHDRLQKAYYLFQHLNQVQATFSFDRQSKLQSIQSILGI